ncbi:MULTISPECIES: carboxylate--amine ligase [Haloferax]|uniref:carboxylate--amine ligase n=1 Tax=Haloferax TaxID=2251 RepID=UPI001CD9BD2C|nr:MULTISPECIES: carboxylate--amine ligase [Haloferax]
MAKRTMDGGSALITYGNYATTRSLGENGIYTIVASEHDHTPVESSRYCDEVVRVPAPADDLVAYKDALVGIAARPDVKTVIPARVEDGYVLSKYYDEFDKYVDMVVQPFELLQTTHDRIRLFEVAEAAGVPIPRTRLLSDVDEFDAPAIIKSRFNMLVADYLDGYDPSEYDIIKGITHVTPGDTVDREEIVQEMKHDPIVQDYIPSAGKYMFAALYDHGEALATFQHLQIRGNSYTGGGGVYRSSVYIPELEEVGRRLLDHMNWHGLACIEYIKDAETGEFKPIEINPRIWQSLPSTVRAGADFPYYYWLQATGQKDRIEQGYDLGVGTHYLWGEIGYLRSVVKDDSPFVQRPSLTSTVAEVATSVLREPHFDILHLDDPMPFVHYVLHVLLFQRTKPQWFTTVRNTFFGVEEATNLN